MQAETIQTATTINQLADKEKEIEKLNGQLEDLTTRLTMSLEENEQYGYLIRNLNNLLKNVYYVYGKNSGGYITATGFSMYYKDKYYLITAGHCVDGGHGKFEKLQFKVNYSDNWVYPKLLSYENDITNNIDYAIFYSDKINNGFIQYNDYVEGKKFILGSIEGSKNLFKEFAGNGYKGESGSPIIDIQQNLIGVCSNLSGFTKINIILEEIDKL